MRVASVMPLTLQVHVAAPDGEALAVEVPPPASPSLPAQALDEPVDRASWTVTDGDSFARNVRRELAREPQEARFIPAL